MEIDRGHVILFPCISVMMRTDDLVIFAMNHIMVL